MTERKKNRPENVLRVPKLLYRRHEAAYALGLSVSSIDTMIADKRLRTRRIGRAVVIPAVDVQRVAEMVLSHDMLQGTSRPTRIRTKAE